MNKRRNYQENDGEFWIALDCGKVIGTLGLMMKTDHCAVMKKFFVKKEYRSRRKIYIGSYLNLQKQQMCSISYWTRRLLHIHRIGFTKKQDSGRLKRRNCRFPMNIRTETAFYIC